MNAIASSVKSATKPQAKKTKTSVAFYTVTFVTLVSLVFGWQQRDEYWIRAEEGLGYALGIIGAVMMLLLLLYPLSKKIRAMRSIIATRLWFRGHMMLGIFGPLLILLHCNFSFGSTNSNVALISMLVVVASGLIGRYLYRQVHNGLYGKKVNYSALRERHLSVKKQLQDSELLNDDLACLLDDMEALCENSEQSLMHNWRSTSGLKRKSKQLFSYLKKIRVKRGSQQHKLLVLLLRNVRSEIKLLQAMIRLSLFTRLFSIWHVVHLPFFYMLIVTALVHVLVVHLY